MIKEIQKQQYREMCEKYTDKKLQKELKSYRKYFQTHADYLDWGNLNPQDFGHNDRFMILRELLQERGLEEI